MKNINDLSLRVVDLMLEAGFKASSAWFDYETVYQPIIRLHNEQGDNNYDPEIVSRFIQRNQERYDKGEIAYTTYRHSLRCAKRLAEVHDTDKVEWAKNVSTSRLTEYYNNILDDLRTRGCWGEKDTKDPLGYVQRYFSWLSQEGHNNFEGVDIDVIKQYLLRCSKRLTGRSLGAVKGYLKKIHLYLFETGHTSNSFEEILSFPISTEHKIIQAVPRDEVAVILNSIDKATPQGERDYAIILLGVVTGLRAVDIANLKLTDIDWQKGEIRIVQSKTSNPLTLPLTKDVGTALRNYILRSRLSADSEYVFNRIVRPLQGHITPEGVSYIYKSWRKKAGLPNHKGQSFHSLRRATGVNLVTSGVPVTMAAQLLGTTNIESVKPYIALDNPNLKICALDFSGIEQIGGEDL